MGTRHDSRATLPMTGSRRSPATQATALISTSMTGPITGTAFTYRYTDDTSHQLLRQVAVLRQQGQLLRHGVAATLAPDTAKAAATTSASPASAPDTAKAAATASASPAPAPDTAKAAATASASAASTPDTAKAAATASASPSPTSATSVVIGAEKARLARLDALKATMIPSLLVTDESGHRPQSSAGLLSFQGQRRPSDPGDSVMDPLDYPHVSFSERKYDFFINHTQATGADQCGKLALLLKGRGATVWYDMHADDLTKQGMEKGMSQSRNILIFLSKGTMKRPYCQAEQRWAKAYGCNFVGVIEVDNRHNAANILEEKENAPSDLKCILDEVEFIPFRRRDYEEATMVEELLKRGGFFDDQESDA